MMINLLLIFPILACILLFLFKQEKLNNFFIIAYAMIHFLVSGYYFISETARFTARYLHIDNSNVLFLMVLSIIFLAVAIYNKRYMNLEDVNVRRKRHYTYML